MKLSPLVLLLALFPATIAMGQQRPAAAAAPAKPKLIFVLMIDQFRYDYLTRFRSEYKGGFDRLLKTGAVFTNAFLDHFPTVTAVGHSTVLTGATPSVSGIIGNDWYDRTVGKSVTSVSDPAEQQIGGVGKSGASSRRMLVDTVGDELKIVNPKTRVIGISLKDRSAILPAGHAADAAYWVEVKSGQFVTSTFYMKEMPSWVRDFNAGKPADRYLGRLWDVSAYGGGKHQMASTPTSDYYDSLAASPYGNQLLFDFSEKAVLAEQLGKDSIVDVLALSLSCNDYVGHAHGPDSPEAHAISVETDKMLDKFFRFLDTQVGLRNVLVVVSADHGVAAVPEVANARRMHGGRMPKNVVQDSVTKALTGKFGEGKWILSPSDHSLYLNRELIRGKQLDEREVQRVAAEAAAGVPHVARVYTRSRLASSTQMVDAIGRRVLNGYNDARGPDLMIVLEPGWMYSAKGTTHGSPYNYDAHVPLVFMGARIKPGRYNQTVALNDVAPTLATMLDVEVPDGSSGRVLREILAGD